MFHLTTKEEYEFLAQLVSQAPTQGRIVDLGVFQGGSLSVLCKAVGDHRVIGIDNWVMQHHGANSWELARKNLDILGYHPRIYTATSDEVPPGIEEVAFIFIDTDHTSICLQRELKAWTKFLVKDAILCAHDYKEQYLDYRQAIDDYLYNSPNWNFLGICETLVGFRYSG